MNRKKEWKKAGFRKIQRESKASPKIMYLERLKKIKKFSTQYRPELGHALASFA